MKSMRKLLGGEVPSSPSIFCTDTSNQFQAALSMEARSRSPLPPSPNSMTNILDMDLNTSNQFKSVDCIANLHFNNPPSLKPKSTSINNIFALANESPPAIPYKPKPLISPTVETNPLIVINAPSHLQPKNSSEKISRKSPNLFRATLVDIDINDAPELQPKHSENQSVAPPLKPKPMKPPRKNAFLPNSHKSANGEDSSSSKRFFRQKSDSSKHKGPILPPNDVPNMVAPYDEVEIRLDAWKTLGVDEMTHTERPFSQLKNADSSMDYETIEKPLDNGKLKEIQNDKMVTNGQTTKPPVPKFLPIKPTCVAGNYDTLNHFGNTSKTNGKSGYKQIIINHSNPSSPITSDNYSLLESYANNQNHTYHDYDEVDESPEACRPADDSHLGYGMIRKKSDAQNQSDLRIPPKHKVYNNMEYAVITKSKHV